MKKLQFLAFALCMYVTGIAQTYVNVTGPAGGSNVFPFANTTTNKVEWLYKPSYFPTAPSGLVTAVYFRIGSSTLSSTYNISNINIAMGQTNLNALTSGTWETAPIVASIPSQSGPSVPGNYIKFNLNTPFYYDNTKNFLVIVTINPTNTGFYISQHAQAVNSRKYGQVSNPVSQGSDGQLVDFGFDLNPCPVVGTQPASQTMCAGGNATFSTSASNATGYQWQVNTGAGFANLSNGGAYNNVTTNTLSISAAPASFNGNSYRCVVSNAICTINTNAASLNVSEVNASATTADVSCNGANDGSVDLTVSGGVAPLSYSWSNSATTQDLSGVGAGSYSVTVTDANGCSGNASATVNEPVALTANAVATDASCNGASDGSADLTVSGGTAPYSYSWSNSASTEDISGLGAGSYNVTITDAHGCTATASATVSEPSALFASASNTNVSCNGGNNGSADLTVSGGTAPYSYNWSNSATSEDISGLSAGTYNVTVTDDHGCTATASATVTEPTALSASATSTNVSCNNGSNGTVNLTVSGGTTPYSYNWSNSATTEDLSGVGAGTYNVTVTDNNGCATGASATVSQPSAITGSIGVSPVNTVSGQAAYTIFLGYGPQSVTLSASATGGTGSYSYSWTPTTGVANPTSASTSVSPTTTTTYTVTITDANGCTKTVSQTINVIDVRDGNKIKICHVNNGNGVGVQSVPAAAVPAHLGHGDILGPCPSGSKGSTENIVSAIKVYPNPSNGSFVVTTPYNSEVSVIDMNGKLIISKTSVENGKVTFDLHVASGVYLLQVISEQGVERSRIVIE
jgi:hypothetical protein